MNDNYEKIQWLNRLHLLYASKNIVEIKADLFDKLDLLIFLHEILADKTIKLNDNETFLESLVVKFYLHGLSICKISNGFPAESNYFEKGKLDRFSFLDISSILTLGRAQMECLLMYQHIYVNSDDTNEQKLRYYSWIYTALLQRRDLPRNENFDENKLIETQKEIEEFKVKIQDCPAFLNLSKKQQVSLIAQGNGKLFKNWNQIFKDCNFSKKGLFEKFYYILSVYAHSEGLSAMQLKHNKYFITSQGNQDWLFVQILTSWFMTGIMIENLVTRFPQIKTEYQKIDAKTRYEVKFLSQIAKFEEPIA